jgi:hypothetical protein
MILGTTTAFAVWDTLTDSESGNNVQIGQGLDLSTTTTVTVADWLDGDQLVPSSAILQNGDVTEANAIYDVNFTGDLIANLYLDVNYDSLLIGGVSTYNSLVNITYSWSYDGSTFTDDFDYVTNTTDFDDAGSYSLPNFYNAGSSTRSVIYVKFIVTLSEPANSSEYNGIYAQDITFNINFEAQ